MSEQSMIPEVPQVRAAVLKRLLMPGAPPRKLLYLTLHHDIPDAGMYRASVECLEAPGDAAPGVRLERVANGRPVLTQITCTHSAFFVDKGSVVRLQVDAQGTAKPYDLYAVLERI